MLDGQLLEELPVAVQHAGHRDGLAPVNSHEEVEFPIHTASFPVRHTTGFIAPVLALEARLPTGCPRGVSGGVHVLLRRSKRREPLGDSTPESRTLSTTACDFHKRERSKEKNATTASSGLFEPIPSTEGYRGTPTAVPLAASRPSLPGRTKGRTYSLFRTRSASGISGRASGRSATA